MLQQSVARTTSANVTLRWTPFELELPNKGMKLTKPERNGALQLIPGVVRTCLAYANGV
jgi:hypothetical protein